MPQSPLHFIVVILVVAGCALPALTGCNPADTPTNPVLPQATTRDTASKEDTDLERGPDGLITPATALRIVEADLGGQGLSVRSDRPVTVELREGHYVVTYPATLPPGTLGGAFFARMSVDATTGAVTRRESSV